jgi:hypothetical protein
VARRAGWRSSALRWTIDTQNVEAEEYVVSSWCGTDQSGVCYDWRANDMSTE